MIGFDLPILIVVTLEPSFPRLAAVLAWALRVPRPRHVEGESTSPARLLSARWALRTVIAVPFLHTLYHMLARAMGWSCP